jgi:DNA-binding SARP family transcriptional activator
MWQDQPLSIHRRQVRALLYCLAAKLNPVPRDQICFGFWPDEYDVKSHRNLSHLLTHLRKALPDPDVLRSANDALELDPQRVWCDAAAFHEACSDLNVRNAQRIEQAVQLYRGPFLSGMSLPNAPEFELWVSEQRSLYERLLLDAIRVLIGTETTQVDYPRAIQYARMYLDVDEMAEDVHRRLMVLHVLNGDRSAALRQYHRCATILKRELSLDPLPETRAVYEAICHQA